MGSCLSKKNTCASSPGAIQNAPEQVISDIVPVEKKKADEETLRKEIFIIKHRRSHEVEQRSEEEKVEAKKGVEVLVETVKESSANNSPDVGNGSNIGAIQVRTSSCTKEELDAILIQCGRLSRSSSTGKGAVSGSGENGGSVQRGRKYSGSKRSYDFDNENGSEEGRNNVIDGDNDVVARERENRHRQRYRQSRVSGSPSKGRRRTPSREREQATQQQRSGSRERGSTGGGRRVSRSPGRRSESPITTSVGAAASANIAGNGRPGKLVSVPPTVSSLGLDRSNNSGAGELNSVSVVRRIQVKRNVSGDSAVASRTAASPRARSPSPARVNAKGSNENQQQQPGSLSRSNSRKAENSPYRRNPLGEIDTNIIVDQLPLPGHKAINNILQQKQSADNHKIIQGTENKLNSSKLDNGLTNIHYKVKEQLVMEEKANRSNGVAGNVAFNVVTSVPEQAIARSRSSRLSKDLDINPDALSNPPPSYTALLLEDIQNFHQKSQPPAAFTLPPCVTKACSILEAVADLNSSTGSNLSSTFLEDERRNPIIKQYKKIDNNSLLGRPETRDPVVESEVDGNNDLMEPSIHKYVTVRRGTVGGGDLEEEESSGSNSFVGSQQNWMSSSWEPNSAESTDRWTSDSKRSDHIPLGFQGQAVSELVQEVDEAGKKPITKKRDTDCQQNGIGRGRVGSRSLQVPPKASAST